MLIKNKLFMVKLKDSEKNSSVFSCLVACDTFLEAIHNAKKILKDKILIPELSSVENIGDCWIEGQKE
jgi:hypothetical protein